MSYINRIAGALSREPESIRVEFTKPVSFSPRPEQGLFVIKTDEEQISKFAMIAMPGCSGVVISTGVVVEEKFRKMGLGSILNRMRIDIAREWGYGTMICTDLPANAPQAKILKKNNWIKAFSFINPRTSNEVDLHYVDVHTSEKAELGFPLTITNNV